MKQYLKSLTKKQQEALAKRCDTSAAYLWQIAGGHRKAGESLAINIERETGGEIRCEDLRPDVDWEFIRNSQPAA